VKQSVRLTRSDDFKRVRHTGKSYAHPLIVLSFLPNEAQSETRTGITVGKWVGGAVERNRTRRRIRALVQDMVPELKHGYDLVWIARQPIRDAEYEEIRSVMIALLRRAGLFAE